MVRTLRNVHKCGVGNSELAGAIARIFFIKNDRGIKIEFHFHKK